MINQTLLLIGSSQACDIIVKKDKKEHFRIEINSVGEAFLFDNVDGKTVYLIDNDIIKTCKREFRWNYPNREQMDNRQPANSQKPKTTLDESDEQLSYSGETDEQRISDEIVKVTMTGSKNLLLQAQY